MAGAPLPRNGTFDGRSIVPALRGEPMAPPPYLFWTWRGEAADEASPARLAGTRLGPFSDPARTLLGPFSAVESGAAARRGLVGESRRRGPGYAARVGEWKAVVHECSDQAVLRPSLDDVMELYNLTADPWEETNLAAVERSVVVDIKRLLIREGVSCECFQC
mmetsp:Transcript_12854/g.42707  ORF Transcript_12854/g.42707 Transcript_12854/m.42707 type:complete len:163 (+) Transcript_12854:1280-1768(+)